MLFTAVLVCLLVLCAGALRLARRWAGVRRYWAQRGVPHRLPHFIWGSPGFLRRENPSAWMVNINREFRSPYIGIWLFWRPALIVNSSELIRNIIIRDFDIFRNRFLSSGKSDPIGNFTLFAVNDPIWSSTRRRMTLVLSSAKLRILNSVMSVKTSELLQRIKREVSDRKYSDLKSMYTDYNSDIIGTAAFGVQTNATLTGKDHIREVTKGITNYTLWRGLAWTSIFFFPELVNIFRFKFFPESSTKFFRRIFRTVVDQRGGYDKEPSEVKDLLDTLLKMKCDSEKSGEAMSEDLLLAQALIFLQAGSESSSSALTLATYELAFQPNLQEKIYNELCEAKQRTGEGDIDVSVLAGLPYLNAVIKETLRKYPPMSWLDRVAACDYKIDDKLTIPKGTPVYLNIVGLHYDSEYFPDPDKFIAERFLPDNEKNIKPYTYLPFGDGPRSCIAKRFALNVISKVLAALLLQYEFRVLPGSCPPHRCDMYKYALVLLPDQPLHVDFVARNH